jgi:hypothetical protein
MKSCLYTLQKIWFFATTFFVENCYKSLAKLQWIVLPATCKKKVVVKNYISCSDMSPKGVLSKNVSWISTNERCSNPDDSPKHDPTKFVLKNKIIN